MPGPRVTLDTNAIIDLEENRPAGPALRELINVWHRGRIELCVSAIAASERYRDQDGRPDFCNFEKRLEVTGLAGVELLSPPGHWDVTFWDHCVFVGEEDSRLIAAIRQILFPDLVFTEIAGEPDEDRKRRAAKTLNATCDIYGMWCHISYGCDVFVTRDERFHRANKKTRLIDLGANQILAPADALAFVS